MSDNTSGSRDPKVGVGEAEHSVSRRGFIKGLGAGGIGSALVPQAMLGAGAVAAAGTVAEATPTQGQVMGPGRVPITLRVNGQSISLEVEPRETLLDVLRQDRDSGGDHIDTTGNKRVCDRATCGACSMIIDGRLSYGCTTLAIEAQGHEIVTVEGVGSLESMHAVQAAFVEHDALMCGFCTPGMVVAVAALLDGNPDPSRAEIRQALDGNICRCGTYPRIFEATEAAAARMRRA